MVWLVKPLLALALFYLRGLKQPGMDWADRGRIIFKRFLISLLGAVLAVVIFAAWQSLPPHYFTRLQLESDRVVLAFRWPEPETLLRPRATLKSRAECHIWYDGRR